MTLATAHLRGDAEFELASSNCKALQQQSEHRSTPLDTLSSEWLNTPILAYLGPSTSPATRALLLCVSRRYYIPEH